MDEDAIANVFLGLFFSLVVAGYLAFIISWDTFFLFSGLWCIFVVIFVVEENESIQEVYWGLVTVLQTVILTVAPLFLLFDRLFLLKVYPTRLDFIVEALLAFASTVVAIFASLKVSSCVGRKER